MRIARRFPTKWVPPAALVALVALAPPVSAGASGSPQGVERASGLVGATLEDKNGWEVGRLEDLLIDPQTNRVVLTVLTVGGRFQASSEPVGLRLPSADLVSEDGGVRSLSTMDERDHLPALESVMDDIDPEVRKRLVSARALLQADLRDAAGNDVGGMQGVVVSLAEGTVRFAVADYDPSWTTPGKLVKLDRLRVREQGGEVAVLVDDAAMKASAAYADPRWPGLSEGTWSGRLARWTNFN
jgi:sporulation protein YlmC with PRC-barrel domain